MNENRDDIDMIYKKFLFITLIIQKKDISDDGIKVFNSKTTRSMMFEMVHFRWS